MLKHLFYLVILVLSLAGCDRKKEESASTPGNSSGKQPPIIMQPSVLLVDASETVLVETPAEVLPTWRKYSSSKPALLLMAKNPLLQTIPKEMYEQVKALAKEGEIDDFRQQALVSAVSPVMLPNMSLSAALDAGFFSRVIWVLPVLPGSSVTLEAFRKQLLELKDITQEEADSFAGGDAAFSGVVRGVPFTVVLKSSIPVIPEPVILHLDLGFLGADYKNEIKTPLYKHTDKLLSELKTRAIKILAVTISASNLTQDVSLRTRFLGSYIRSIMIDPTLLGKKLNGNATLRNEALYLGNFFKKEEVLELHRKMVANNPEDASAHYDLYQTLRQFNKIDEALEHLDLAANQDLTYAMEYLDLADVALEKNRPDGALRMLKKAATFFPDNPFLEIGQAEILIRMGYAEQLIETLAKLKKLPWSTIYHGQIPGYLDEILDAAEKIKSP